MAGRPDVSVCIPAYNHEKYVRECITSILDQDYKDLEIVITDDFSTDGTVVSACMGLSLVKRYSMLGSFQH